MRVCSGCGSWQEWAECAGESQVRGPVRRGAAGSPGHAPRWEEHPGKPRRPASSLLPRAQPAHPQPLILGLVQETGLGPCPLTLMDPGGVSLAVSSDTPEANRELSQEHSQ